MIRNSWQAFLRLDEKNAEGTGNSIPYIKEKIIMGMTMAEKILSRYAGHEVKPGEIIVANIDATMSHDANRPLALDIFQRMNGKKVFDPR